jgi:AcrR family transcriptional regulator
MQSAAENGERRTKSRRTRAHIADTAARLFAEHGYEQVTVTDVARAADVAERTLYNHFATKEDLVLDRDTEQRDRVAALLRERAPGTAAADAVRPDLEALVEAIGSMAAGDLRGRIGYLALVSPTVRRMCLDLVDRHADAYAAALLTRHRRPGEALRARAKLHGVAIAWVYQSVLDGAGRGTADGLRPPAIARRLRPGVAVQLADLAALPVL